VLFCVCQISNTHVGSKPPLPVVLCAFSEISYIRDVIRGLLGYVFVMLFIMLEYMVSCFSINGTWKDGAIY
jgi:hypothetical protein